MSRFFAPTHSCGGLVASVGVLFLTGAALLTTLPGSPAAALYPVWLTWTFRLAPIPAFLLLWAVASEGEFKVKTDGTAIYFRHGLGQVTRVPWRGVSDYFADCGRGLAEVAGSGGSLVHQPDEETPAAPFAAYGPDYTIFSDRGTFIFDDGVLHPEILAAEVVAHAAEGAPSRWEEASWATCEGCGACFAVSLWPVTADGEETELCGSFTCPACDSSFDGQLPGSAQELIVEFRGSERTRIVWRPSADAEQEEAPAPEPSEEAGEEEETDETEPWSEPG